MSAMQTGAQSPHMTQSMNISDTALKSPNTARQTPSRTSMPWGHASVQALQFRHKGASGYNVNKSCFGSGSVAMSYVALRAGNGGTIVNDMPSCTAVWQAKQVLTLGSSLVR